MSVPDSGSSTDNDNTHGFIDAYQLPDVETVNASDGEIIQISSDSGFSESLKSLNCTSENLDWPDDGSSCSSKNFTEIKCFSEIHNNKIKKKHSFSNYWCPINELYKREIGQYNHCARWGYKFYQSAFAVEKLKVSKQFKSHQGCVNSLDYNKTGELLLSGSDDQGVKLWNWTNLKCMLVLHTSYIKNIKQTKFLTTQENYIVTSGKDGKVLIIDMNRSDISSDLIAYHQSCCNNIGLHHDTPYVILSCGGDGNVKNIDLREYNSNRYQMRNNLNLLHIINDHGSSMYLYGIDINPLKSNEFIVNGDDEYIRIYDKRNLSTGPIKQFQRKINSIKPEKFNGGSNSYYDSTRYTSSGIYLGFIPLHKAHITSAVYNYCGTQILASYSLDDIYLFDVNGQSNSVVHSYSGHLNRMTGNAVNFYGPRSEYVVSGSHCGSIFIWDKKTEVIVQMKQADTKGLVTALKAHPHMPTLATSGLDSDIKIWEPLSMSQPPSIEMLTMSVVKNRLQKIKNQIMPMFPE